MSIFQKGAKCTYRTVQIVGDGKHTRQELYDMAMKPPVKKKPVKKKSKKAVKKTNKK